MGLRSRMFIIEKKGPKLFMVVACCTITSVHLIFVKGNKISTMRQAVRCCLTTNPEVIVCKDGGGLPMLLSDRRPSLAGFSTFKNRISLSQTYHFGVSKC